MYYSNKKTTEISNPFLNQTVLSCILLIAIRLAQSAYVDDKTNVPSFGLCISIVHRPNVILVTDSITCSLSGRMKGHLILISEH